MSGLNRSRPAAPGARRPVTPCFTAGTGIATPTGERLVETLRVGDPVITRDNGIRPIRWVGRSEFAAVAEAAHLRPILIRAGALGHGLPERDMTVSPGHRVLVLADRTALPCDDREVFVAARYLVNNRTILPLQTRGIRYFHFMFDRHEVVLSNGAWTESFQPEDRTLGAMAHAQRAEILDLFPALGTAAGKGLFTPARRILSERAAAALRRA